MHKVTTVAIREFVETVRTKAFLISSVIIPLVMIGIIFGSERFASVIEGGSAVRRELVIVNASADLFAQLTTQVEQYNTQSDGATYALVEIEGDPALADLKQRVQAGEFYAYLIIPDDVIEPGATVEFGRADSQFRVRQEIRQFLTEAVVQERFARAGVDAAQIAQLRRPVPLEEVDVATGARAENQLATLMMPFVFMFVLFLGTFGISQGLLTSLIEEKSSRVVEVLLAAVSPLQLMAGKIIGMIGVGFVVIGIWGAIGYFGARYQDMAHLISARDIFIAVLYFVPTFLMFGALLAGVGSAFNSLKEAQTMTFPLSIAVIIPMMLWFQLAQNPDSVFATTLSFIPPLIPFVMILRISADPGTPVWQIAASLIELWVVALVCIWAAAKIFRIGLLMHGQPPSFKQLTRWVRG
jgi:ABC-2 type transport system permease protein